MRTSLVLFLGLALLAGCGGDDDGGGSGGDAGPGGSSGDRVVDPAPGRTQPGEYGCDGCPDADITEFELDLTGNTSNGFAGNIEGADGNGVFYLENEDGQSIGGPIETSSGSYSFTVPLFCGTQLLKCVWNNDQGEYVAVVEIVTADCIEADIRVTLTWDDQGDDFDLHLIKEGGKINDHENDCTWNSCTTGAELDWGVADDATDNPQKDVDDLDSFGPENIFYAKPEDGTYTVMVEHYGAGLPDADGLVTINLLDSTPVVIPITNLVSHHVFTAGTIEWPSKRITPIKTDFDCSAEWSGGCTADLP